MNIKVITLCTIGSLLLTAPGFAQGKGGGRGGGGPSSAAPSMGRPGNGHSGLDVPDTTPRRHSDAKANETPSAKGNSARSAAPAAQGLATSMHDINQAAFAQRRELHATLDMRLKSSHDALKQIQSQAKDLRADARADFKKALDDVKARERDLTDTMKASRKATEANWPDARERLARAYQAHADAMARAEALGRPPIK